MSPGGTRRSPKREKRNEEPGSCIQSDQRGCRHPGQNRGVTFPKLIVHLFRRRKDTVHAAPMWTTSTGPPTWIRNSGITDPGPFSYFWGGHETATLLTSYLHHVDWIVVVVDIRGPTSADLLDDGVTRKIYADLRGGIYVVGIAKPCETVSPLREKQPGPRPLRSLQKPDGLPKRELTKDEQRQLAEANNLFEFTENVAREARRARTTFWIENPDHKEKLDIWKTSWFRNIGGHALTERARFDQCWFGAETTKPIMLMVDGVPIDQIHGKRCNHPPKEWTKPDGEKYMAPHESLVQRWRTVKSDGVEKKERASKALGEYPPAFNKALAEAMGRVDLPRVVNHRKGSQKGAQK